MSLWVAKMGNYVGLIWTSHLNLIGFSSKLMHLIAVLNKDV